jgi:hypothetical protein
MTFIISNQDAPMVIYIMYICIYIYSLVRYIPRPYASISRLRLSPASLLLLALVVVAFILHSSCARIRSARHRSYPKLTQLTTKDAETRPNAASTCPHATCTGIADRVFKPIGIYKISRDRSVRETSHKVNVNESTWVNE